MCSFCAACVCGMMHEMQCSRASNKQSQINNKRQQRRRPPGALFASSTTHSTDDDDGHSQSLAYSSIIRIRIVALIRVELHIITQQLLMMMSAEKITFLFCVCACVLCVVVRGGGIIFGAICYILRFWLFFFSGHSTTTLRCVAVCYILCLQCCCVCDVFFALQPPCLKLPSNQAVLLLPSATV